MTGSLIKRAAYLAFFSRDVGSYNFVVDNMREQRQQRDLEGLARWLASTPRRPIGLWSEFPIADTSPPANTMPYKIN